MADGSTLLETAQPPQPDVMVLDVNLGLGLYISNEVIHRHGGQIEMRSNAVEGTTFRVILPGEAVQ